MQYFRNRRRNFARRVEAAVFIGLYVITIGVLIWDWLHKVI